MRLLPRLSCIFALLGAPTALVAQLPERPELDHFAVRTVAVAAVEVALENEWPVTVAIVDAGGHLLFLERLDGAILASVKVAARKARTAVHYRLPTSAFQSTLDSGQLRMLTLPGAIGVGGGFPLRDGDFVVGGIGVSGGTIDQDERVARAGMEALPMLRSR